MTKTKRVRIVVAVDREGQATATTNVHGSITQEALDELSRLSGLLRFTLIEADVPLPKEPAVVQGEVVDG